MPEISTNYDKPYLQKALVEKIEAQPKVNQSFIPQNRITADEFWRREKRKNTGLIERLYNKIKNATGLGTGSKKVERALNDLKAGNITQEEFSQKVKDYNSSQETSAQAFGDLMSVGAAGLTYFGLRNLTKLNHAGKELNKKFGKSNKFLEAAETVSEKFGWKSIQKGMSKLLAHAAKSKTKLAVILAGISAMAGGMAKVYTMQINRIGSQEFKTNKKDFNGAVSEYDHLLYKTKKKMNRSAKRNSNLRNSISLSDYF